MKIVIVRNRKEIYDGYIMQKIKLAEFRKNGIKKCELSCRFGRKCQLTQKELMLSEVPEMPMNECLLDKESMCMGGYLGAVVEFDF